MKSLLEGEQKSPNKKIVESGFEPLTLKSPSLFVQFPNQRATTLLGEKIYITKYVINNINDYEKVNLSELINIIIHIRGLLGCTTLIWYTRVLRFASEI